MNNQQFPGPMQQFPDANQQFFGYQPQPIPVLDLSSEITYGAENFEQNVPQPQFTRAEKRKFDKLKKAHLSREESKTQSSKEDVKHKAKKQKTVHQAIEQTSNLDIETIDDIIAALLTLRKTHGPSRKTLKPGSRKADKADKPVNRITKNLEQRVTRDAPKKAEPSTKKLEKIQKRKEIRAEKRKARMAQREQEAANQSVDAPAATSEPNLDIDEVHFTEL